MTLKRPNLSKYGNVTQLVIRDGADSEDDPPFSPSPKLPSSNKVKLYSESPVIRKRATRDRSLSWSTTKSPVFNYGKEAVSDDDDELAEYDDTFAHGSDDNDEDDDLLDDLHDDDNDDDPFAPLPKKFPISVSLGSRRNSIKGPSGSSSGGIGSLPRTMSLRKSPTTMVDMSELEELLNTLDVGHSSSRNLAGVHGSFSANDLPLLDTQIKKTSSASTLSPLGSSFYLKSRGAGIMGTKCSTLFIGGPSTVQGRSTFTQQNRCHNMTCTKCDYRVIVFDHYRWDDSCTYLFFRNNYPKTLQTKLRKDYSFAAYCCQCAWISVDQLVRVSSEPQLNWICSGHG